MVRGGRGCGLFFPAAELRLALLRWIEDVARAAKLRTRAVPAGIVFDGQNRFFRRYASRTAFLASEVMANNMCGKKRIGGRERENSTLQVSNLERSRRGSSRLAVKPKLLSKPHQYHVHVPPRKSNSVTKLAVLPLFFFFDPHICIRYRDKVHTHVVALLSLSCEGNRRAT